MKYFILTFMVMVTANFALGNAKKICTKGTTKISIDFNKEPLAVQFGQQEEEELDLISRTEGVARMGEMVTYTFYRGNWKTDETRSHLEIVSSLTGKLITIQFVTENPNGGDEYFTVDADDCRDR